MQPPPCPSAGSGDGDRVMLWGYAVLEEGFRVARDSR